MIRHLWVWPCLMLLSGWLVWDYVENPRLFMFLLFVRPAGQSYTWDDATWSVQRQQGHMVVEFDCRALPLIDVGPYYAVVKATDLEFKSSDESNEVGFYWDRTKGCIPLNSPSAPSGPVASPQLPPPTQIPPAPQVPPMPKPPPPLALPPMQAPPPSTASGGTSGSCLWEGTGCTQVIPTPSLPPSPSGRLGTDLSMNCLWTGKTPCP